MWTWFVHLLSRRIKSFHYNSKWVFSNIEYSEIHIYMDYKRWKNKTCKHPYLPSFHLPKYNSKLHNANMSSLEKRCKTCGRTLVKLSSSQYEICPVCETISLFNKKLKGRVLNRIEQITNVVRSPYQEDFKTLPSQTSSPWLSRFPQIRTNQLTPRLPLQKRKKAVLCGVTYNGHRKKLEASVHNVRSMQQLLVNKLGFQNDSIRILTGTFSLWNGTCLVHMWNIYI